MKQLKVGDRVKIRTDSQYHRQSSSTGTIMKMVKPSKWISVKFDDSSSNSYHLEDLELAHINWRNVLQ